MNLDFYGLPDMPELDEIEELANAVGFEVEILQDGIRLTKVYSFDEVDQALSDLQRLGLGENEFS